MSSSTSRRRLMAGSLTAIVLALSVPIAAGGAQAAPAPAAPRVIHTVPSDTVGGLPLSSLDDRTEYIPAAPTGRAVALHAPVGGPPRPVHIYPLQNIFTSGSTGYDISWPNCGQTPPASSIAIVGVDHGHPITQNTCLAQEAAWSPSGVHADYMVLDSPVGWTTTHVLQYAYHGPAGDCTSTQYACQSYNWGYNAALYALQYAQSQNADATYWWLDVELSTAGSIDAPGATCYQPNVWICDTADNALVISAARTALANHGKIVGEYSAQAQWQQITGGLTLSPLIWVAGWNFPAATYCDPRNASTYWFGGGQPWLVQSQPATYDPDTAC
jgi:hypothetical protein